MRKLRGQRGAFNSEMGCKAKPESHHSLVIIDTVAFVGNILTGVASASGAWGTENLMYAHKGSREPCPRRPQTPQRGDSSSNSMILPRPFVLPSRNKSVEPTFRNSPW